MTTLHAFHDRSSRLEALAWLGALLGALIFMWGTSALWGPARHQLYGAAFPPPDQITAYTVAICGALYTAVNTLLAIHHRLKRPDRRPRKRRKPDAPKTG